MPTEAADQTASLTSRKNESDTVEEEASSAATGVAKEKSTTTKGSDGSNTYEGSFEGEVKLRDVFEAKPKTFNDKWQLFLYNKGMGPMPLFMKNIYLRTKRQIYVNQNLPEELCDSNGNPLITYPRNKIRTTKYTPISFLPKNILFQFTNIANFYFLILVILGAFQIFGVASPGMAAVPLIVIVCITAVKDAFEDYKRADSDSDLNNSPIHLLNGLPNSNVLENYVSGWRKFKKQCTRITKATTRGVKKGAIFTFGKRSQKDQIIREEAAEDEYALRRVSTVVSDYSYRPSTTRPPTMGRPSTASRRLPLSQPLPNTLLNPVLQKQHVEDVSGERTRFKNRRWKDVSVGDIIRVRANEEIPADVIIISTSDIEGGCYIETKNLDGESNLKNKNALRCGGSGNLKHSSDLGAVKFWVECDAPNGSLYTFKGTVHYENYSETGELINADEREAVTADNVLLRGSTLRNTKQIIGLVIYTGDETKIMINSGITPTKQSRISRELNLSVIINFLLLFVLCFVSGLLNGLYYNVKDNSRIFYEFKPYGSSDASRGVIAFFVALIIYQSLVPISLYISVEIIKTLQALFIYSDVKMYYERLDFPCVPKSWNISDDLGQIEYVFSDKTGTLTQNVMEFKKCTVNGVAYGLAYTEAKQGLDKRDGLDPVVESEKWKKRIEADKEDMISKLQNHIHGDQLRSNLVTFCSSQYVKDTIVPNEIKVQQKSANESFMLALALCHTVVTEENPEDPSLRDFKAESPDEAALVAVARDVGIVFKERLRKSLIVEIYGTPQEYHVLETIAFTSARKRMSSIIRAPDGKVYLITKGADNVIFSRLASNNDEDMVRKTALHLEGFANEGLRTLCIAQKELDNEYAEEWLRKYKAANESISDNRDLEIERLDDELEQNLQLLGGTAIEDRLQDGVPDSISVLGDAGIKLWVLTGDRIETAINIGFSCNLLETTMSLLVVRPDENDMENEQFVESLVTKHLQENFDFDDDLSENVLDEMLEKAKNDHSTPSGKYALIIDGAALSLIYSGAEDAKKQKVSSTLQKKFLLLGKQCKSVLCCRVSPSQKAQVVKMVRDSLQVMTLAIGDGANDVAMIQAANVGVGIAGEEGRQAVMSSDYAIGQFRFLTRLLLVHGRWSYKRLAEMVPCFFYKNVVFTLTCFWFGIYNNFDGSYLYEYTYLMFYNLAFTSLPVIFLAVLDQDVSDTVSLLVPQLYRSGILGLEWSQYKFAWYMLDGLYQSVIAFFFPYLLFYKSFQSHLGLQIDHRFWIGVVSACISVTACNFYVLLKQYRWDWLTLLIDAISVLLVFFWTGVWSDRVYAGEFYKAGSQTLGTLSCWCCIFIGILLSVLPRFTADFLLRNFKPADIDIVREQVRNHIYDGYPEGYDPTNKEDLELHRLGLDQPTPDSPKNTEDLEKNNTSPESNPISRTLKTIKRKATLTRSKATDSTLQLQPSNIETLRQQLINNGDYEHSGASLNRINTTHELPGITQAETLLSYHTRNSIQLDRQVR